MPIAVNVFWISETVLKTIEGRIKKTIKTYNSDYRIFDWLKFESILLMYEKDGKLIPITEDFGKLIAFDDLMTTATTALEDQVLAL